MFRFEATADHLPAFELERVLERCAWTDLIHIVVDGAEVYRDDTGLETDLVPALDVVRETLLERFTPFEVALGRRDGDLEIVTVLTSSRFHVTWLESVRDRGLDRGGDETDDAYLARIRDLLKGGYLADVRRPFTRGVEEHLNCVAQQGLVVRPESLRGPWLHLRGDGAEDTVGELHRRFGGGVAPLGAERALLAALLDDPGAPDIDVRVDHYGEVLSLTDFRDVLEALATPRPDLPEQA